VTIPCAQSEATLAILPFKLFKVQTLFKAVVCAASALPPLKNNVNDRKRYQVCFVNGAWIGL